MNLTEHQRLYQVETHMWWFRGLHANLIHAAKAVSGGGRVLLDAGCGTGGLLACLNENRPEDRSIGLDLSWEACCLAATRANDAYIAAGSVTAIPLQSNCADVIFSVDVLCHAAVTPKIALAELYRCLKPGGRLIMNLPAYNWLASAHDRRVSNVRRFTCRQALKLILETGFIRPKAHYWNSLLFPLMVLQRLILRREGQSDVEEFPVLLDRLFYRTLILERYLRDFRITLPFGGSILVTAEKA